MKPEAFQERLQGLLLLSVLMGAAWLATVAPNPAAPVPADAPMDEFSAERALVHVRSIAQTTHPIGSPANAAVRAYISSQLSALGLVPETQAFSNRVQGRAVTGVNVMARLPGLPSGGNAAKAVALVGHYDSAAEGPGASDDGSAVATLLETARALRAGPALQNDVILLFTDGEEAGLLGASAFVKGHPWMKEIGLVLNFEARGVSGPVYMFETRPGNGWVISEFGRAAPRPTANSLMYEVYRRMPNDTDFSVFKGAGVQGLNFAFIGEPEHYHTPTDDLAHFNLRCLQHDGSYALSLTRHFGNLDLTARDGGDAVYFDLFGRVLVRYPAAWALPLAGPAAVLWGGCLLLGIKRGQVAPGQLALAALGLLMNVAIVLCVFRFGPGLVAKWSRGVPFWSFGRFAGWPCWFASVGLTVALNNTLHLFLRRWTSPTNLALGALAWWAVLAVASALWLPGGSYVVLWPFFFALFGAIASARVPEASWKRWALLAAAALPTMILLMPLVHTVHVALGWRAMLVPMVALTFGLGLLVPHIEVVAKTWHWKLPVAGLTVALVAVAWCVG